MKIHLVDGTYELFRAHYSPGPSRTAPDGTDVKAARGLFRTLVALLKEPDVSHVAVAFDTVVESFRNELFEGYKTGEGIDPALFAQFPLAEEVAESLGLVVWPMIEFETDDALASAARLCDNDPQVDQVVICSPDKDFAQCVRGHRVVMWDRRRDTIYDETGVREKWGITPDSMPDWLALVGDTADGIPRIAKWGAKSAAKVLSAFTHLEAIPRTLDEWPSGIRGAKGLLQTLTDDYENALLYRRLATLRTDVPLRESAEDLRWQGVRCAELEALSRRLGDVSVLKTGLAAGP